MVYLSNAFSLQMARGKSCQSSPIGLDSVKLLCKEGFASCVGHADTAVVLSSITGFPVACNRVSVDLSAGDILLVGQYVGTRLPEGATALPEGSVIEWYEVRVRA